MKKYDNKGVSSEDTKEIKKLGKLGYRIVAASEDVVYMERELIDTTPIEAE